MSEGVDVNELRANLEEYHTQLSQVGAFLYAGLRLRLICIAGRNSFRALQVEALLLSDPENVEYRGIYDGLAEARLAFAIYIMYWNPPPCTCD
jgi:hypothetical protein